MNENEPDYKIASDYLRATLAGYQAQVGDQPLLPIFTEQTRKVLAKSPTSYLRYGPYWWAMKRILRAGGVDIGLYDEPVWANEYAVQRDDGTVDAELTLLAGWEFADTQHGQHGVLKNEYELAIGTLVLDDPDQRARH